MSFDETDVIEAEAKVLRSLADDIAPTDNWEDAGNSMLGALFYGGARGAFAFAATLRGMAAEIDGRDAKRCASVATNLPRRPGV